RPLRPPAGAGRQPALGDGVVEELRDRPRPPRPGRLAGRRSLSVSRLEDKLRAREFVLTSELPAVNGGGLDAVRERLEGVSEWVDAMNATDNTSAHARASRAAASVAPAETGRVPRPPG